MCASNIHVMLDFTKISESIFEPAVIVVLEVNSSTQIVPVLPKKHNETIDIEQLMVA